MSRVARRKEKSAKVVTRPGGDVDMLILPNERQALTDAMQALDEGDSCQFCNLMWLGMGDRWRTVLEGLARGDYVRILDCDACDGIEITPRGKTLAADLGKRMRRSA